MEKFPAIEMILKVTQGYQQCHSSIDHDFLLVFYSNVRCFRDIVRHRPQTVLVFNGILRRFLVKDI